MNGNTCSYENQVNEGIYKACLHNDLYISCIDVLKIVEKLKQQRELYAAQMLLFQKNILEN